LDFWWKCASSISRRPRVQNQDMLPAWLRLGAFVEVEVCRLFAASGWQRGLRRPGSATPQTVADQGQGADAAECQARGLGDGRASHRPRIRGLEAGTFG